MRGFWHIVDAVIACVIIIGFMLVLSHSIINPPEDLGGKAYDVLAGLDEQGILRGYVAVLDHSGLNSQIKVFTYNHAVQICDIGGSCVGEKPTNTNIWVGSYIVSGSDSYQPRIVKLYLWS